MLNIRTILFGTDFSADSDYAFSLATALARDYHARLLIAHVREVPIVAVGEFGYTPPDGEDVSEAEERLTALKPSDQTIEVDYLLAEGSAGTELIRLADDHDCDLIVVGSHGHTGLARLLMGSVAERIVRGAHCPVLVVKQPLATHATQVERESEPSTV
jgi:nucleotide-binding universal stress UspA family protein